MNSINRANTALWKQMLLFFLPILTGTFFQQLYNTVDAVVVGKFVGKEALAAVGGTSGTLINLLVGFFVGLAGGATVIIAQCYGASNKDGVSKAVHTGMALALTGGAVLSVVGVCVAGTALKWMGTPDDVYPLSHGYMVVYFLGMIPNLVYNIGAGILQAVGDSRRPLLFLIAACVTNIILDLIFVVGLRLGVVGAALATILSQTVAACLVLYVLLRTDGPHRLVLKKIKFHGKTLLRIVQIGIPSGIQSSMYAISNVLIQSCVNSFGTDVMAAYTAFSKLDALNWMASGAFGTTVATFAGQFFGAGDQEKMKQTVKIGFVMNAIFAGALCLVMQLWGENMLHLFLDDEITVGHGVQMIRLVSIGYLLFIPCEICSAVCRSAGDTLRPMLMTATGICGFRILWIYTAVAAWHRTEVLFICFPLSWILTGGMLLIYYFRGTWNRGMPTFSNSKTGATL